MEELQEWAVSLVSGTLLLYILGVFVIKARSTMESEASREVLTETLGVLMLFASLPLDQIEFWIILLSIIGGGGYLYLDEGGSV